MLSSMADVWFCWTLWRSRLGLRIPGIPCCSSCELSSSCPLPRTWDALKMTCAHYERNAPSLAGASANTSWFRYKDRQCLGWFTSQKERFWATIVEKSMMYKLNCSLTDSLICHALVPPSFFWIYLLLILNDCFCMCVCLCCHSM